MQQANCKLHYHYNATLLSGLYRGYKKQNNTVYCDLIKRLSPVAWQHINLVGKYEFCKNQIPLNIQDHIEYSMASFEANKP